MADTVALVLDRRTAENFYYALAMVLGGEYTGGPIGKKGGGKGKGNGKGKGSTAPKNKVPKP
jgi:hypothetical protein